MQTESPQPLPTTADGDGAWADLLPVPFWVQLALLRHLSPFPSAAACDLAFRLGCDDDFWEIME